MRELGEGWFAALTALVRHVAAGAVRRRAHAERPAAGRADAGRDRAAGGRYGAIEDILPLSPLQEGLLFHALYDAAGPDVYTVQLELELEGALDAAVLQASMRAVVGRHASLRAAFCHEQLSGRCRWCCARAAVPWRLIDLSGLR